MSNTAIVTKFDNAPLIALAHAILQHVPHIARGLGPLPAPVGVQTTHCPQVFMFHQTCAQVRQPALYKPGLILILSGHKYISLGAQTFDYDSTQGLLLTAAYPVLCTAQASAKAPLLGLYIALARPQVAQLLRQIQSLREVAFVASPQVGPPAAPSLAGSIATPASATPDPDNAGRDAHVGITPFAITPLVQQAVAHLLAALADPIAAALFGPERSKALLYTLL